MFNLPQVPHGERTICDGRFVQEMPALLSGEISLRLLVVVVVVSPLHLFKRGSSCRVVVGRRKTLFARENPHSFCLRRGRSAARARARARHPHTTSLLIKARTVIARKIYDEKGKDTESP